MTPRPPLASAPDRGIEHTLSRMVELDGNVQAERLTALVRYPTTQRNNDLASRWVNSATGAQNSPISSQGDADVMAMGLCLQVRTMTAPVALKLNITDPRVSAISAAGGVVHGAPLPGS